MSGFSLLEWIGSLPEDELDLDTAVKMLESAGDAAERLSPEDRQTFIRAAELLPETADGAWDPRLVEKALVALNLVQPSGRFDDAIEPYPKGPVPDDLDSIVDRIRGAVQAFSRRRPEK